MFAKIGYSVAKNKFSWILVPDGEDEVIQEAHRS